MGIVSWPPVALAAGIWLFRRKPSLHGAVIDPPLPAAEIQLQDFNDQAFSMSGLRGKVVILYFGYTNCPDECPLTMAHLKQATDILGDQSEEVQVVMISTDPARDTPQAMKDFLGKFDPRFVGLVGTAGRAGKSLERLWRDCRRWRGNAQLLCVRDRPRGKFPRDLPAGFTAGR